MSETPLEIVLATGNRGKIHEFEILFANMPVILKSFETMKIKKPEIREYGKTFRENSIIKASETAKLFNLPAIADDSGLAVTALNGAPGVFSARYAGEDASDKANNLKLLENMAGIIDRSAKFLCVIAVAKPDGDVLTFEGVCKGKILNSEKGNSGFGYDPLFWYPPLKKTFAQLTVVEKNKVSHRGKAIAALASDIGSVIKWLTPHSFRT